MTNVFYHLLSHPAVYKRLQAEIDSAGDLDSNALATLPYLNAVM
jgi:cytochrome P450